MSRLFILSVNINKILYFPNQAAIYSDSDSCEVVYNPEFNGYIFDLALGDCGMPGEILSKGAKNYLKFTTRINFTSPPEPEWAETGISLGIVGDFRFSCNYRADYAVHDAEYTLKSGIIIMSAKKLVFSMNFTFCRIRPSCIKISIFSGKSPLPPLRLFKIFLHDSYLYFAVTRKFLNISS